MHVNMTAGDVPAAIASPVSECSSQLSLAEVQTKTLIGRTIPSHVPQDVTAVNRMSDNPTTGGATKRRRLNARMASSAHGGPQRCVFTSVSNTQISHFPEASAIELVDSNGLVKSRDQHSVTLNSEGQAQAPTVVNAGSPLQPIAVKQSDFRPGKRPFTSFPVENEATEASRQRTSSSQMQTDLQSSASKIIECRDERTMEPQPVKIDDPCGKSPDIATRPVKDGQKQPRGGIPSSEGVSIVQRVTVPFIREVCPPTPDSTGELHLDSQTLPLQSSQSDDPPQQPNNSGAADPGCSDVRVVEQSQPSGRGSDSSKGHAEPGRHAKSVSLTQATDNAAKDEFPERWVQGELDTIDVETRALGEQVKSTWAIRTKQERLTKAMKALESRRRGAHLRLRTALARMDADIKEHVGLSSELGRLQGMMKRKEREVAAIVQRVDIGRDVVKSIRSEQQTYEDSMKTMEAEFSSSGKQLQGVLLVLGILC